MPLLEPLSSLKLIAVILLDHLISHCRYQNSFSGFRLSQPIISRNDLLYRAFGIVLEFHFPIIECLGISIALFSNLSKSSLIEYLLLVLIELHELVQV